MQVFHSGEENVGLSGHSGTKAFLLLWEEMSEISQLQHPHQQQWILNDSEKGGVVRGELAFIRKQADPREDNL